MNRKTVTAILPLVIIATFLLGACAPTATAQTTTSTVTEAVQSTTGSDTATTTTTASEAGVPPSNGAGGPPPGTGTGGVNAEEGLASASGAYTLDGVTATESGQTYTASETDQSGVYVINSGTLTLTDSIITTSGDTSSDENSSFYGLNAAVLAASASTINLSDSSITTSGTGANGAFATGSGSSDALSNVTINATGNGGHGVMATQGGSMTLIDVDITTSGVHSAPIATDRGSGTISVTGGIAITSGQDSPCYYSTGVITVSDATCTSIGSESAVIEGANSIILANTIVESSIEDKWGVMIYQSFSGDAEGTDGTFTMTGGSLAHTASNGPLFYVTNSTGTITLTGVDVTAASGTILEAGANERWGTSGSNGGTVIFTADGQTLTGDMTADSLSSITATLQNGSSLTGSINPEDSAKAVHLTVDASSTWTVTADSYLTCLSDPDGISGSTITNINGNGYTVHYDQNACAALGGETYTLNGGGTLEPAD